MTERIQQIVDAVLGWWFKPFHLSYFRFYEWMICATMLYYFGGYLMQIEWWIGDMGFHASAEATSTHYLSPPPVPPAEWYNTVIMTFTFLCGVYLLGYGRRVLNWVFFALCVYVQAVDQPSAFTINRMLIIYFLMLAIRPPVFMQTTDDGEKKPMVSGWLARIIQITLGIQYTASGFCKMDGGWIRDGWLVGNTVWTQSQGHYKNLISAWAVNDLPMPFWYALAAFTLVFETGAIVFFFWKRTRIPTVIAGLLMHIGIAILMKDLIFFSVQMMTAYIFFVPEKWVVELHQRCRSWMSRIGL